MSVCVVSFASREDYEQETKGRASARSGRHTRTNCFCDEHAQAIGTYLGSSEGVLSSIVAIVNFLTDVAAAVEFWRHPDGIQESVTDWYYLDKISHDKISQR